MTTGRYQPQDLGELMRYCEIVVKSGSCPRHIQSPADVTLIIQRGAELGLSAVNALQNLNVINGKVTHHARRPGRPKTSVSIDSWTYLPDTLMPQWCDIIEQRSADTGDDHNKRSDRARWVRRKLTQHAQS